MQITNPGSPRVSSTAMRTTLPAHQRGMIARSLVALLALAVLGASATAITYLITNRSAPSPAAPASIERPAPIFATVEPFTVTLAGQDYERMLHVGITLKLADERSRSRVEAYMPVVRSRILLLLAEQDANTVQTTEGRRELANAVRHSVSAPFDDTESQQVIDVLFTAFVVQ